MTTEIQLKVFYKKGGCFISRLLNVTVIKYFSIAPLLSASTHQFYNRFSKTQLRFLSNLMLFKLTEKAFFIYRILICNNCESMHD